MLKSVYKKLWVPVMGRLVSLFIPLIEGKQALKTPSYDIDGEKKRRDN